MNKALLLVLFFLVCTTGFAAKLSAPNTAVVAIIKLTGIDKMGEKVNAVQLPAPYNTLLTQPLMTKAIETYYERKAIVTTLDAHQEQGSATYHRSIIMLVDRNKVRNQPETAQAKKEAIVTELAFITINFAALPAKLVDEVLHTHIPFGQLLMQHHLQILKEERSYFKLNCNDALATFIACPLNHVVYGRKNTIIRADNKQWLAHVTEILPNPEQ